MTLPKQNKAMLSGILSGLVIFLFACITSVLLYRLNNEIQLDLIHSQMGSITRIAALEIDVEELKLLSKPEQTNSKLYKQVITPLVKIHNSLTDILYVYTMTEIDGRLYYILDTMNDSRLLNRKGHNMASVMEEYEYDSELETFDDWLPMLKRGEIDVEGDIYLDNNTYIMSTTFPLFSQSGEFYGLLGIDFNVDMFEQKRQLLLDIVYLVITLSFIISTIIGWRVYVITLNLEKLHLKLYQDAHTDYLTGASNRRNFIDHTKREINRSNRSQTPLTLLLVDIDHFKQVNDTYGHLTGDQVLTELVILIQSTFRSSDIVARYGGEEFVILLAETDLDGATIFAQRIQKLLSLKEFTASNGEKFRVTISIGISNYNADKKMDLDSWFNETDKAMYQAKTEGRNKIVRYKDL